MNPRAPRSAIRKGRAAALILGLLAATPPAAPPAAAQATGPAFEIVFLDAGQADAIVLRAPTGEVAMIDAGRDSPLRDLARLAVDSLVLLIGTNPDEGSIGGIEDVVTARPVDLYLDNGVPAESETYATLMATLERLANIRYGPAEPGRHAVGEATLEVLPMPGSGVPSVGVVLRYGRFSAFFPGGADRPALDAWVDAGVVPPVTMLTASRHGAADGFTVPFVEAAAPELVVISVGAGNPRLDPQPQALTAYGSVADRIVRTDLYGEVTVRAFPDGSWEVSTERQPTLHPAIEAQRDAAHSTGAAGDGSEVPVVIRVDPGPPDGDDTDLNGEFVALENVGDTVLEIGRWRVCDLSSRCFRFPDGVRIPPGRRVVVHTGFGMPDGTTFFMNNDRPVWNDNGDEALLYDAEGRRVVRHVY